ncbi:MAG TPA: hypothetical protein VK674_02960 [Candidatus Limnocylindria bacterium]|nr:hypothetical protein [Candidatus Limnocylindria bacterium]
MTEHPEMDRLAGKIIPKLLGTGYFTADSDNVGYLTQTDGASETNVPQGKPQEWLSKVADDLGFDQAITFARDADGHTTVQHLGNTGMGVDVPLAFPDSANNPLTGEEF